MKKKNRKERKQPRLSGSVMILASASPWRKRLLVRHGIACRIHVSAFLERRDDKNPRSLVLFNARGKAADVARYYKDALIIGVDTVGVLAGRILGKPANRRQAKAMLRALSGRAHRVISGLCVMDSATGKKMAAAVTTKVVFRQVGAAEIEQYLDSGQWKGKAGSYAIQGRAKGFVEKIEGDVTNVVGLPIPTLKKMLQKLRAGVRIAAIRVTFL